MQEVYYNHRSNTPIFFDFGSNVCSVSGYAKSKIKSYINLSEAKLEMVNTDMSDYRLKDTISDCMDY